MALAIEPADPVDPAAFYGALEAAPVALLLLTRRSCGACRAMKQALVQLPASLGAHGALRVFEADVEDSPELVEEFEIFHLPGLIAWRGGEYHAKIQARATPAALEAALLEALARPAEPEP
ncbi:hypothetical protein PPSIR1_31818 [Plesiocystis pacifica SIR-1]|uniref:Thioredoxin domain-containing protein n=1 Tax=Plesiocystis pacifica SIR-1 TaxID=391625 RepID=A6G2T1_9BACT|nr:thioredoxin family protein [Plesiocystis pacifica]EDM79781.1 hypothetical protein PPSIR1_31818 [Plesiocystis pacifica SIR-1]